MNKDPLVKLLDLIVETDVPKDALKYTTLLREAATAAGWPPIVVIQLNVIVKNGYWDVIPPDSIRAEYDMLEYGIPYGQPNSVVRPFLESINNGRVA